MGLPPTPRSTPPASTTMPPPRPVTPPKAPEQKVEQGDMFLRLLQGSAITITIGYKHYTLPINLLCAYSGFFKNKITSLVDTANKKRKLTPSASDGPDEEAAEKVKDEDADKDTRTDNKKAVLALEDVDPNIFGLFLKFIYTGGYNPNVDARPVTGAPMTRRPAATYPSPYPAGPRSAPISGPHPAPTTAAPGPQPASTTAGPPHKIFANFVNNNNNYISPETALAVLAPSPPVPDLPIPSSIHAYLLAQRLQSVAFMNHTLVRIYNAIGVHFTLSPSLIDFVWVNTSTTKTTKIENENEADQPTPAPIRAPLRKLLLDILVMHWPTQHTHIIARNNDDAWNAVFDAHQDLRREFILGLQGGAKVMPVQKYFVQTGVVVKQEG